MGLLLALGTIDAVPRVVIPVGGMVVSTAMVTAGLALQRTVDVVGDQRARIEARLALGLSTASKRSCEPYRTAMRTALVPAVDTTKVVGLISLPGAMTGLILAGVDPWDAIRYQIVVMYMLLGAAFMAAVLAARSAQRSLFDDAERLVRIWRTESTHGPGRLAHDDRDPCVLKTGERPRQRPALLQAAVLDVGDREDAQVAGRHRHHRSAERTQCRPRRRCLILAERRSAGRRPAPVSRARPPAPGRRPRRAARPSEPGSDVLGVGSGDGVPQQPVGAERPGPEVRVDREGDDASLADRLVSDDRRCRRAAPTLLGEPGRGEGRRAGAGNSPTA